MIKKGQVWVWPRSTCSILEYYIVKKVQKKLVYFTYYSPDVRNGKLRESSNRSDFEINVRVYKKLDVAKTMRRMIRIENKRG